MANRQRGTQSVTFFHGLGTAMRPCLFCGNTNGTPTDEHVLQHAFGTTLVLDEDVCGTCNTHVFSGLDDALVKLARRYAYRTHPDMMKRGTPIDGQLWLLRPDEGPWLSYRLTKTITPLLLPQLVQLPCGEWRMMASVEDHARGVPKRFLQELRAGVRKTEALVCSVESPPVEPAVIRSGPGQFALRGADAEAVHALGELVQSGTLLAGMRLNEQITTRQADNTWLTTRTEINLGSCRRALAKTALNAICAVLGPDEARMPRYDPLRNFAYRGGHASGGDFVRIEVEPKYDPLSCCFADPGEHAVVILPTEDGLQVFIVLFGLLFAVIRADEASLSVGGSPQRLGVFVQNYRSGARETFRMTDNPAWFAERLARMGLPPPSPASA